MEEVGRILEYGDVCDHCLGRFYGRRSFGLTNKDRGSALRIAYYLHANLPFHSHEGPCWICGDLFAAVPAWAGRVVHATEGIEFSTFLIGTRVPPLMAESEEMVWSDLGLGGSEALKSEMNREVGKAVSELTGKSADLSHPEVVIILDLQHGVVEVQISPLFIYGRYRKFERGIPQTHWDCRVCRGAGCERCNFTGKMYPDSVEELIGRPVTEFFGAESAVLHGAGREDIDARMVGTGRPFVLEVVSPRRRSVDLHALEELINEQAKERVSVSSLRWSRRDEVEIIKSHKGYKKYRILIEVESPLSRNELQSAIEALKGVKIEQRTPQRVAHRRADLVRERKVLDIEFIGEEQGRYLLEVTGEAGLYIKELISGDNGRTRPSLAEILGRPAQVCTLDVVQVEGFTDGE
nr:tRNA pseudouridine(54/55) synthase Pus10 [Methanolinea mesophila]